MQIHELIQGSPEWHAHRGSHFNASDAPAMMGCSPYKTRSELIREYATGLGADVDANKQRLFDAGHRYEALARQLAEEIIGEDLYPLVGTEGVYSASFDGLTLLESVAWEHKSLNNQLREVFSTIANQTWHHDERGPCRLLPLLYRVQMEQQCMVSGCERILFTATKWADDDTLIERHHCWYYPDPVLRDQIVRGWKQFEEDVAAYVPVEVLDKPAPTGHAPDQLPALRSAVRGELVLDSNIKEWEAAALAYIQSVRDHELVTDEDFENAGAAADWCESSKTTLIGVKAQLMSATGDVNTAVATIDRIAAELDKTRIAFTNAIKARKDAMKAEIVASGRAAFTAHFQALTQRLGGPYMPPMAPDFAAVVKGLKSLKSMREKVDAEVARLKIDASVQADKIDANLKTIAAAGAPTLFPDKGALVLKAADDLAAVIAQRLAAEQRRQDDERERIRKEEVERVEREKRAEAENRMSKAYEAAKARAGIDRPYEVFMSFAGTVASGRYVVPLEKVDEYIAALNALQQQPTAEQDAPAEKGNVPLPAAAGTYASNAPEAAQGAPSGDEGQAAHAEERAAAPALLEPVVIDARAPVKLGDINATLGFTMTGAFVTDTLGVASIPDPKGRAVLFNAADVPRIYDALIAHITKQKGAR